VKIRSRISCLSACLCAVPLAHALGMGGISGSGGRGYPLDAYVTLYAAPSERQTITGAELLPDITLGAAADRALLSRITASIEHTPDDSFVHLASALPLAVDRISFRLRVTTTRGALVSHYDLRLADMRPALASMPSLAPTRDIVARPRSPRGMPPAVVPAKAIGDGGSYGPVRSGDSLWLIAKRLGAGANIQKMMDALHALNPHAFVGGEMSRLRVGVMLQTPRGSNPPVVARSSAPTGTGEPAPARREEEVAPVRPAAPAAALVREPRADGSRPAAALVRQRGMRDPVIAARLAELDAKFAAIRARYGEPVPAVAATVPVTVDASGLATTAAPAVDATPLTQAPDAPAPVGATAPAQAAEPVPGAATRAVTAVMADRRGQSTPDAGWERALGWAQYAALGLVLFAVVAWAALGLSKRLGLRRAQTRFENHRAADADRKAEVARKAENRVRMETEIKGLLDRKGAATGVSLATSVQPHAITALPPLGAADSPESAASQMNEASRDIAIDTSIAHGRYAEAETLLRDALRANPRNVQSKLRLAELYYITEQVNGFAELAAEMKEQDRASLSDEEWKRVVRMGKILAPEMMPFSGPRMVGLRA